MSSLPFLAVIMRGHRTVRVFYDRSLTRVRQGIYFYLFSVHHYLFQSLVYSNLNMYLCKTPSPSSAYLLHLDVYLFLSSFPVQIHGHILQYSSLYYNISLICLPLSLSISCISLHQSRFTLIIFNSRSSTIIQGIDLNRKKDIQRLG